MSVNTPASWSAHALRPLLGMPSGPAALRGLTRLNVLLTSAAVMFWLLAVSVALYCPQSEQKKLFSLPGIRTSWSVTVLDVGVCVFVASPQGQFTCVFPLFHH
jgi:hypothetical protein